MFLYSIAHGLQWNLREPLICGAGAFLILLSSLWIRRLIHAHIEVVKVAPRPYDALILFLSHPLKPEQDVLDESGTETAEWKEFQQTFPALVSSFAALARTDPPTSRGKVFGRANWCMPLEAVVQQILLHEKRGGLTQGLKHVVVIGSADTDAHKNGTWREVDFFRSIVDRIFETAFRAVKPPEIVGLPAQGVAFEQPTALSEAVNQAYDLLEQKGAKEVLIDATGGTKQCSIVAAALTFEPGRCFQYLSTSDLQGHAYDVEFKSPRHNRDW